MVVEHDILPFFPWFWSSLLIFLVIVGVLSLLGAFFGFLVATARHGPAEGFFITAKVIFTGVQDLVRTSPRRTYAMARLAVQESLRRRVLVAFAIFVVLLLFAGWFLDVKSDHPARLYLSFVLTSTNYLILLLALFLSTFSLPNDIKNRTIYTIVTKPVRPGEIVLGRMLGFSAIGTVLLAVMCLVSYIFVTRGLDHRHEIAAADIVEVSPETAFNPDVLTGSSQRKQGQTSYNAHHRHTVTVEPDGRAYTDTQMDHSHSVRVIGEGDDARYELGAPVGMLQARVPVYGKLRFLDAAGYPAREGINVGNEWTYRSYIEGGSLATAIWTYDQISEAAFPDGLRLELNLRVFRTHKGNIEKRVNGEWMVKNPNPAKPLQSEWRAFVSEEFSTQQILIPRQLKSEAPNGQLQDIDLMRDLVHDGKVEVWIRCADGGQYFGVAQADVYLRAADRPFFLNLVKGYVSIWLQMIIVTCFGVTFSTFLSGAVGMMGTVATVVLGFFTQFVVEVASGVLLRYPTLANFLNVKVEDAAPGGGPLEALVRTFTQQNITVDLDEGLSTTIIQYLDLGMMLVMRLAAFMLPKFRDFSTADYVAYGFNISGELLSQQVATTFGFAVVLVVIGYFFLKTRELAA